MIGEKRRRTRTATATVEASTRTRVSARRRSVKARHPVRRAMAKVTELQGHPGHQGSAPERDRPPTWFLELRHKLYRRGSHLAHLWPVAPCGLLRSGLLALWFKNQKRQSQLPFPAACSHVSGL